MKRTLTVAGIVFAVILVGVGVLQAAPVAAWYDAAFGEGSFTAAFSGLTAGNDARLETASVGETEGDAYAILVSTKKGKVQPGTLLFFRSAEVQGPGEATVDSEKYSGTVYSNIEMATNLPPWYEKIGEITAVSSNASQPIQPESCESWFADCQYMESCDLSGFDTSKTTSFRKMFNNCMALSNLTISNLDTSSAKDFSYMFYQCNALSDIDVSSFDTQKATTFDHMFYGCSALKTISGLDKFNTSQVTNMAGLFERCSVLEGLDLASFSTASATTLSNMFNGCAQLKSLTLGSAFSFKGKDSLLTSSSAGLLLAHSADQYADEVGYWKQTNPYDPDKTKYTSDGLSAKYDGTAQTATFEWVVKGEERETYTVVYHDGESESPTSTYDVGSSPSFAKAEDLELQPPAADADWIFAGWSTDASDASKATQVAYEDGAAAEDLSPDADAVIDLYAVWKRTAKLEYSGGDGAEGQVNPTTGEQFYSRCTTPNVTITTPSITLAGNSFTKQYHKFTKWLVGTSDEASPGDAYDSWTPAYNEAPARTAVAQWEKKSYELKAHGVYARVGEELTADKAKQLAGLTVLEEGEASDPAPDVTARVNVSTDKPGQGEIEFAFEDGNLGEDVRVAVSVFDHVAIDGTKAIGANDYNSSDKSITVARASELLSSSENERSAALVALTEAKGIDFEHEDEPLAPSLVSTTLAASEGVYNATLQVNPEVTCSIKVSNGDAYAVLVDEGQDDDGGTLVMFRSARSYTSGEGKTVVDLAGNEYTGRVYAGVEASSNPASLWEGERSQIKAFRVAEGQSVSLSSCRELFKGCVNLAKCDMAGLDTSAVTDMSEMFSGCKTMGDCDLSSLDTANVTNYSDMFEGCASVRELDVSKFETQKATQMSRMFEGCAAIERLDLSAFKVSAVTGLDGFLAGCSNLSAVTLPSESTSELVDCSRMFDGCSKLAELDLPNLKTSKATNFAAMFRDCSTLRTLDLSGFVTTSAESMWEMFSGCSGLETLDVSHFATAGNKFFGGMFKGCSNLSELDLSRFDTTGAEDSSSTQETGLKDMLASCSKLRTIKLGSSFSFKVGGKLASDVTGLAAAKEADSEQDPERYSWVPSNGLQLRRSFTSAELNDEYDGSAMSGTFTWQVNPFYVVYYDGLESGQAKEAGVSMHRCGEVSSLSKVGDGDGQVDLSNPSQEHGWGFAYWADAPSSVKSAYQDEGELQADLEVDGKVVGRNDVVKLYAVWKRTTTLSYDANSGDGTTEPVEKDQFYNRCAEEATLTAPTFTLSESGFSKSRCLFRNWKIGENSSAPTRNAGETYGKWTPAVDAEPALTAFAQWLTCELAAHDVYLATTDATPELKDLAKQSGLALSVKDESGHDVDLDLDLNTACTFSFEDGSDLEQPSGSSPAGRVTFALKDVADVTKSVDVYTFDHTQTGAVSALGDSVTVAANDIGASSGLSNLQVAELLFESDDALKDRLKALSVAKAQTLGATPSSPVETTVSLGNFEAKEGQYRISIGVADGPSVTVNVTVSGGTFEPNEGHAYAVLSNKGSLTFFRSRAADVATGASKKAIDIAGNLQEGHIYKVSESDDGAGGVAWSGELGNIETVAVAEGQKLSIDNSDKSMAAWFANCPALKTCDFTGLDVSRIKSMKDLFSGDSSLERIVWGEDFKTTSATDFSGMFYGCAELAQLDASKLDSTSVADMSLMFEGCKKLTSLDLSNLAADKAKTLASMFENCSGLSELSLFKNDTSAATDLARMFAGCSKLASLDLAHLKTSEAGSLASMFSGCSKLREAKNLSFGTAKVRDMTSMFEGCSLLESLDVSSFSTSKVTSMRRMFANCSKLVSLDVSGFDTASVADMRQMFRDCSALTELKLKPSSGSAKFTAAAATNLWEMFAGCSALATLDVSAFNTARNYYFGGMFSGCSALTELDLTGFDTSAARSSQGSDDEAGMTAFVEGCTSIEKLTFGAGFTFQVGTEWPKNSAGLESARPENADYGWIRTNPASSTIYSSAELFSDYKAKGKAEMAGTYEWQKKPYFVAYHDGYASGAKVVATSRHVVETASNLAAVGSGDGEVNLTAPAAGKGWEFAYWVTSADSTAAEGSYADKAELPADLAGISGGDTFNLYAVWKRTVTLKYDGNGGSGTIGNATAEQYYNCCTSSGTLTTVKFKLAQGGFTKDKCLLRDWLLDTAGAPTVGCGKDYTWSPAPDPDAEPAVTAKARWLKCELSAHDVYLQVGSAVPSADELGGLADVKLTAKAEGTDEVVQVTAGYAISPDEAPDLSKPSDGAVAGAFTAKLNDEPSVKATGDFYVYSAVARDADYVLGANDFGGDSLSNVQVAELLLKSDADIDKELAAQAHASAKRLGDWGAAGPDIEVDWSALKPVAGDYDVKFKVKDGPEVTVKATVSAQPFEPRDGYAYAMLDDRGNLTFFRSSKSDLSTGEGKRVTDIAGNTHAGRLYGVADKVRAGASATAGAVAWSGQTGDIKSVSIASGQEIEPSDVEGWFAGCENLESCDLTGFDFSEVASMKRFFAECSKLDAIEWGDVDTSSVQDMTGLFKNCTSLSSLEAQELSTERLKQAAEMFSGCSALGELNLSSFNWSNVESVDSLFAGCTKLRHLDFGDLSGRLLLSVSGMFDGCKSLERVDATKLPSSGVMDASRLFAGCSALAELDLSQFDASKLTNSQFGYQGMRDMFSGCTKLVTLKLGKAFSFKGNGSLDPAESGLLLARPKTDGIWVLDDGSAASFFDTEKLVADFGTDDVPAGTYLWRGNPSTAEYYDGTEKKATSSHVFGFTTPLKTVGELGLEAPGDGWEFAGWSLQDDGVDIKYADGEGVSDLAEGSGAVVPLYAVWKRTLELTYEAGEGATGEMGSTTTEQRYNRCTNDAVPENLSDIVLADNGFSKPTFAFDGWKVDGGDGLMAERARLDWTPDVDEAAKRNAQAQWVKCELDAHDVFLQVGEENLASRAIMERAGMSVRVDGAPVDAEPNVDVEMDVDVSKPGSGEVTFKHRRAADVATKVKVYVFSHLVIDETSNNAIAANDMTESGSAISVEQAREIVNATKSEGDKKLVEWVGAKAVNLTTGEELTVDVSDRGGFAAEPNTYTISFHANPTVTSEVTVSGSAEVPADSSSSAASPLASSSTTSNATNNTTNNTTNNAISRDSSSTPSTGDSTLAVVAGICVIACVAIALIVAFGLRRRRL